MRKVAVLAGGRVLEISVAIGQNVSHRRRFAANVLLRCARSVPIAFGSRVPAASPPEVLTFDDFDVQRVQAVVQRFEESTGLDEREQRS